jgi:sugar phosphate permease
MSSVFEAGITLACIIILHNWFKEEILGTITALWYVADFVQCIIQIVILNAYNLTDASNKATAVVVLRDESYILFGFYVLMSLICWFFFYHHPSHIGIQIRKTQGNSNSFGFVVDNTHTLWSSRNPNLIRNSSMSQTNGSSGPAPVFPNSDVYDNNQENQESNMQAQKMDVTLIDAFKIKEINLLIISYIFSMCHNLFVLKSGMYVGTGNSTTDLYYNIGSIVGVILSGMLVDLVFKKRRFLTIFFLAIIIFAFDLYLFIDDKSDQEENHWFFMLLLGATLSSSNLIYLILIPMLIAKQYSEEMAENQRF